MTATHWPWTVLQIAPTEDRKTIRDAYSRLLKALDPDAATEAFMELREARDGALSGHFLHPPRDADDEDEADDFGLGDPLPEGAPPPPVDPEPAERPQFTVEYSDDDDKRFQRVVDLFTGEGDLAASEIEELHTHLDTLLADDRMADLGHYARVENWLAQLLAERYPRGAALFPRVAEHFHWGTRAHELGIHPAIPWLFNSHEGHSLVHELGTPGHAYHREWAELVRGKIKGPLWLRAVDKQRMANLIATIRRDYPWLEQDHWQPELVARWEKKVEGGGVRGPSPWVWIIGGFLLLSVIARIAGSEDSATNRQDMAARVAANAATAKMHIEQFLENQLPQAAEDGRTIVTLQEKSQKTYDRLVNASQSPSATDETRDWVMMREIYEIYFFIVDKLPHKTQVADAKFRAATLKRLQADPQACVAFIRNPRSYLRQDNSKDVISPEYRYQMFSVVHDEYGDSEWPFVSKNFEIPGEVVGKIIDRSGLSEARLRAAISKDEAPDADVCIAMRSLYEILTEIPQAQASKILPALM